MTEPSILPLTLQQLTEHIAAIAQKVGRCAEDIHLLAISKGQSTHAIEMLIQQGQLNFGENYLQEAIPKITALKTYPLNWHFVGHLQSNKAKTIAHYFDWVHSVDNLHAAISLDKARSNIKKPLNICIQVNLYDEDSKAGVSVLALETLLPSIAKLPHLALRGLMTLLPQTQDALTGFTKLARLQQHYQQQGFKLDTLSMGMSNDYPAAIEAGATWLRIGTALFGPRNT